MAITVAEVETAITAIQDNGQTFTIDGMQYSAANINALITLRDKLNMDSGRVAKTRPTARGFQFTGMGY